MRYISLFLLLSFFGSSLPAFAQKGPVPKQKTMKLSPKPAATKPRIQATNEASPVLTFERTPCFGTCPAYSMKVFADGRVAYEGRHAVPIMGQKDFKLPASAVADLLRQAKEAHFEQFQDRYSQNTTDLPSIIVAIRQPNGKLKTVVLEEGAPENVRALFTYFGNQLDQLAQLNGVEK